MSKRTEHYCDVCRRELPVLGNANRSGNTSVYRVKETYWQFFSQWLSWQPSNESWQEVCGDCWEAMTEKAREMAGASS